MLKTFLCLIVKKRKKSIKINFLPISGRSYREPPSLSPLVFRVRLNFLNVESGCDGHPPNEVVDVKVVIDGVADAGVLDAEDVEEEVEHEADAASVQVGVEAAAFEVVKRHLIIIFIKFCSLVLTYFTVHLFNIRRRITISYLTCLTYSNHLVTILGGGKVANGDFFQF